MKSTIRLSLALLCLIFSSSLGICQSVLEETFQIKDAEGKDYTLEELRVSNGLASLNTEDNCSDNSYFNLFFEQGSGFEDYANNPVHAERAEVLCQVFSDLSTFIQPLIDNPEINILVRAFEGNPSSYAGASALYFVPSPNQNNSVSIVEGMVWQCLNTPQDPYESIALPLVNGFNSNNNPGFYHAIIQFNFQSHSFDSGLNSGALDIANDSRDLYSVALHEALHTLDFRSLFDVGGISAFGENQPFFTRFDSKLKSPSGDFLIQGNNCNPTLNSQTGSLIWPDPCASCEGDDLLSCGPDAECDLLGLGDEECSLTYCQWIDCGSSIIYEGTSSDIPVSTPACFLNGTSLSHISEVCYGEFGNQEIEFNCDNTDDPVFSQISMDPIPFVMYPGNSIGQETYRRIITPEERGILCDLGYNTLSTWVAPGNNGQNFITYSQGCPGTIVSGTHDILVNGSYRIGEVGVPMDICAFDNGSGFLENDFVQGGGIPDDFECFSLISGSGGISSSDCEEGKRFTPTSEGFHVLRYKPRSGGFRGNWTYIAVLVPFAECIDQCSIIPNGGFENFLFSGNDDGCFDGNPQQVESEQYPICWDVLQGTPDYFDRICPNATRPIPFAFPFITNNEEQTETWDSNENNEKVIALRGVIQGGALFEEAMKVQLTTPLQNGIEYTISFFAKEVDGIEQDLSNYSPYPQQLLMIACFDNTTDPDGGSTDLEASDFPGFFTWTIDTEGWQGESNSEWKYYEHSFNIPQEFGSPNSIIIVNNGSYTKENMEADQYDGPVLTYLLVDDFTLTPSVNVPFLPNCVLNGESIDLANYLPEGSWVTMDDGTTLVSMIELGSSNFPNAGTYDLIYHYPFNNGTCIATEELSITLQTEEPVDLNVTVSGDFTLVDDAYYICSGSSLNLTSNQQSDITWFPSNDIEEPTSPTIDVSPESSMTYTLQYDGGACPQSIDIVVVIDEIEISAAPTASCDGEPVILTAEGGVIGNGYTWTSLNTDEEILGDQFIVEVYPSEDTDYQVTGLTDLLGCQSTANISVNASTSTPFPSIDGEVCLAVGETFQVDADTPLINEYSWAIDPNTTGGNIINGGNSAEVTCEITDDSITNINLVVTGTNINGCVSTQNVSIEVNPIPNFEIVATPSALCNTSADVTFSYTPEYDSGFELWENDGDIISEFIGNEVITLTDIDQPTTVSLSIDLDNTGCIGFASLDLELLNYSVSITDENASICLGESIDLEAVIDGGEDVDYSIEWTFNGDVIEDENETLLTYTPLAEGSFVVSVIPDQCIDIGQPAQAVTIFDNFNPDPVIEFIDIEHYCAGNGGEATVQVTEDGVIVEAIIEWVGLGNSTTQTDLSPGTYTVNVTGTQGCTASASIEIIDEECCPGQAGLQLFMNNGEFLCSDLLASNFNLDDGNWLVPGNLVIDVNYSVTDAQFYFNEGTEVVIQEGISAEFFNCLFSTCENSWEGIKAVGDQTDAMSLEIKNSTIEYAKIGIETEDTMVEGLNSENWNGAAINVSTTSFLDCERAISFSYCNYFNADLNDQDLSASFIDCSFNVTPEYDNRFAFDQNWSLVKYDHVRGYSFEECIFENNRNQSVWEERGVAIFAVDARFNVVGDFLIQDVNGVESKIPNPLTTEFSGFMEGIYDAITLDSFNHMNVYYNNFAQNQRCIYTEGMCWQDIILNEFELGEILPQVGDQAVNIEGYVAVGGSFFRVEENEIVNAGNNTLATTIGIRIVDTNSPNDQLYANDISSCDYGVLYSGDNNTNDLDFLDPPGFRTVCHTFNNNVADIFVSNEGAVDENQWSFGVPANDDEISLDFVAEDEAANTFTDDGILDNFNHFQEGGQEIIYHTFDSSLPFDFSPGITVVQSFSLESPCNSNDHVFLWDEETAFDEVHLGNWVDNSVNLNGGAEEVKFLIKSLIDDGDTPELQSELELAWSDDTWIMRDKLLAISPYVSRDVLYDVADDVVLFPHSVALEIFIANPDVMRDLRFLHHLETKANPMPAYMIELLYAARDEETSRSILNRELARLTAIERTVNQVALHYVGEMKEINWTQVQALHDLNKDYTDDMRAAEWMLAGHIPGNWTSEFAELTGNPGIRGNDNEEVTSMHEFLTILEPYLSSANSIMAISSSDLSLLEQLALNKERLSGSRARSVLNAYYGFNLRVPAIIDAPELFFFQASSNDDVLDRNQVKVYPSPASTRITFDWSKIASSSEEFTLEILDQTGRIVHSETLTGIREQSSIDCTQWSSSSYIYKLYSKESEYVGRFEIIH